MRWSSPRASPGPIATLVILAGAAMPGKVIQPPESAIQLWPVDSMVKVFEDTKPPAKPAALVIDAARNEVVSAQFAVRAAQALTGLRCTVAALAGPGRAKIEDVQVRFVGFVPVRKNSDASALRKAPTRYGDPLLEEAKLDLPAGKTQPVWITVRVPKKARPGEYVGQACFRAGRREAALPLTVQVHKALLPDKRTLWVTNWTCVGSRDRMELVTRFPWRPTEKGYWTVLRAYTRNMAAHRQNVILTPIFELIAAQADGRDRLAFDFRHFDRWVRLFQEEGVIGRIEGGHLAGGRYGTTDHRSTVWVVEKGKAVRKQLSSWGRPHKDFLAQFLPALQAHLAQKGWLNIYLQHVFDEPTSKNADRYKELAAVVKQHAPRLRTVEATHCHELVGSIDTWVPQLDHYSHKLAFYRGRQEAGEEVWFYTCCGPRDGRFMNRFMDYHLLKVRLLHWVNAKYGAAGYLHWGWNQWTRRNPFEDVENDGKSWLPPGDRYIVYPSPGGVLDSIRHEAMLEGIQDYELLKLLAARSPEKARAVMDSVVRSFTDYRLDAAEFRAARRALLTALSQ